MIRLSQWGRGFAYGLRLIDGYTLSLGSSTVGSTPTFPARMASVGTCRLLSSSSSASIRPRGTGVNSSATPSFPRPWHNSLIVIQRRDEVNYEVQCC